MFLTSLPTITSFIQEPLFREKGITLAIKRLDLLDPIISGNKAFKLKYNLETAVNANCHNVLTFGGAFSNHIVATAKACSNQNLKSIGIIRGEESSSNNHTLSLAKSFGMELFFVSRELYRDKNSLYTFIQEKFGDNGIFLIPEGGANAEGVKGASEIIKDADLEFDTFCVACGTGTTLAGIALALPEDKRILGFPALKGGKFLYNEIEKFCAKRLKNLTLITDYHFGGYAKITPELLDFAEQFNKRHQIELDFIYTAKMLYGLYDLIRKNYFPLGTKILVIHSGGVQGNEGFLKKTD